MQCIGVTRCFQVAAVGRIAECCVFAFGCPCVCWVCWWACYFSCQKINRTLFLYRSLFIHISLVCFTSFGVTSDMLGYLIALLNLTFRNVSIAALIVAYHKPHQKSFGNYFLIYLCERVKFILHISSCSNSFICAISQKSRLVLAFIFQHSWCF